MRNRPIVIAVGGDSGSGKTTLCRGLVRIFGEDRIATVCLDDYHSLDRRQRRLVGLTAADPRANNFAAMEDDLWALREGRAIEKPVYDHTTGTFAASETVEPRDILVIEGLFPLATRALRSLLDVSVWLDPEPALQAQWKLQRDTVRRGYTPDEVRAQVERRTTDVARFIAPQASRADLTLTFYEPAEHAGASAAHLSARIRKGGRLRPLDYNEFASSSTSIRQIEQTAAGGYPETIIELDGHIDPTVAEGVEDALWSHLDAHGRPRPQNLGEFVDADGSRKYGYALALAQMLIARRVVLIEHEQLEMAP